MSNTDPRKAIDDLLASLEQKAAERRAKEPKLPTQDDPIAPEGKLWVCHACGKTAKDRYGEEGGWDESCMLNSGLYDVAKLIFHNSGRLVARIRDVDEVP